MLGGVFALETGRAYHMYGCVVMNSITKQAIQSSPCWKSSNAASRSPNELRSKVRLTPGLTRELVGIRRRLAKERRHAIDTAGGSSSLACRTVLWRKLKPADDK